MREANLTRSVLRYLDSCDDVWAMKIGGGCGQKAGVPDIIGSCRGQAFALEIKAKTPGGYAKQTKLQEHVASQMRARGGYVTAIVYSVNHARFAIDVIRKQSQRPWPPPVVMSITNATA